MRKEKTLWYSLDALNLGTPREFLLDQYKSGKSFIHIAEYLLEKYKIEITPKGIEYYIPQEERRTRSEARKLAIKSKRMIYKKKTKREKYHVKYVPAGIRLKVLLRDEYRCTLCGNGRKEGYSLELHHKEGIESTMENLETLCYLCHRGLHENKRNGV